MKKALTLTVVANMTSNYSDSLGNITSVQKIFKDRTVYAVRSRESLKNAIMRQAGMYDDLYTEVNGVAQKYVDDMINAATCRALEGGYMYTKDVGYVRKSSIYLTDAVSCESYVNEVRFHNNMYLAQNYAEKNQINFQKDCQKTGFVPYQYEFERSLKIYSMTIDLQRIGKDENFHCEADPEEKSDRVCSLLYAVETLSLLVKGNLDNAEPVFIVGGLSDRKTHYFENVVHVRDNRLEILDELKTRIAQGYHCGLLKGNILKNQKEIEKELNPVSVTDFFSIIRNEVKEYFNV